MQPGLAKNLRFFVDLATLLERVSLRFYSSAKIKMSKIQFNGATCNKLENLAMQSEIYADMLLLVVL